jgi:two-component system OmpR family response regulator
LIWDLEEEDHAVDVVSDGESAEWTDRESPYDSVIVDVMLLGLSGFEVCWMQSRAGRRCPILLLTDGTKVRDGVHGLYTGAVDYLIKPFSIAELTARLGALTRQGQTEQPPDLEVGDADLAPTTRRGWQGGTALSVSAKQFGLLELFIRNPGLVLARAQIASGWDWAHWGVSKVVDWYVAYLHPKIHRPFGCSDRRTVRGARYRPAGSG